MKKINWHTIRLVLIIFVMIFLYSFSSKRNSERKISKIDIKFESNENMFLTHEMVNNLLIQKLGGTSSIQKDKLDLNTLETVLDDHEMIEKAQVFSTIDGLLNTRITQKTPIVRVITDNDSYYLDSKGDRMSLSQNFSARVPLVSGEISIGNEKPYLLLFNEIKKDDFLSKNITGAQIMPSGNVVLTNRSYDYKIAFGKPINVEKKLKNYKAFFQHAIKDTLIKSYKEVNVMFTQQVVCKK
ncbi:cell division protein FtsQ/DivIB [Flavobacterium sp. N2820]|jgi:cell division protein FtsQ|uniref:cell division protein FtsQ/DivIB n=1 Tax=Flavobacterium sp. N2820 TaxID=2986834 RepID=UPI0022256007|nr:cell division protein FtsQ [Flavobacterium sp. N2820]